MKFNSRAFIAVLMNISIASLLTGCGGGSESTATGSYSAQAGMLVSEAQVGADIAAESEITIPLVSYTDTLTGPTQGGENGLGGYLSIFGSNFGVAADMGTKTKVLIGGFEVANYRYLGPAKVASKLGVQQLTVQVGNLGGAVVGKALDIQVIANGVASAPSATFTPTSGRVLFVSLAADAGEANAMPNAIDRPYRWLQNVETQPMKGAYFAMKAGDQVVIRGGNWSDTKGVDGSWLQFGMNSGARNGRRDAWIHFTAYPGEDVHYTAPPESRGGFQGPWSDIAGTSGEYIAFSNLRMDVAPGAAGTDKHGNDISELHRDAAPFNLQFTAGHWRVINNEIGPWFRGKSTVLSSGGVAGHGDDVTVLGNHIHHIEGVESLQNHGIYADTTAKNWNVGYNWIHDITGGSHVQFNDNSAGAGILKLVYDNNRVWPGFVGIRVHHNWLENASKYGVNFSDEGSTQAGQYEAKVWNNVIIGTKLPPLRILSTQPKQSMWFAFNTISNAMTEFSGTGNGYVRSEGWSSPRGGAVAIKNKFYNNIFSMGPNTTPGTQWFVDAGHEDVRATKQTYDFKNNLFDFTSYPHTAPTQSPVSLGDTVAVLGNPLFVNGGASDFRLQMASPARNAAVRTIPNFVVSDDITRLVTRTAGSPTDIGAYVAR